MIRVPPLGLILIGLVLVVAGVILPFLMVIRLVPSTFFMNFLAYGASVLGLCLGLVGASLYVRGKGK